MAEIKDSKLIRDALGSPVPQYWDETSQMYIARTVDGSFADVDFSKVRLLRDKLGSPIPQLWDVETARFVPGKGDGNGEVTIESVPGLRAELDETNATLAETASKTELAAVASGAPKGTYATLSALQTAFPTGNANIYLVTADGKWYYWSGSAWTAGGIYQSTGIADKSIAPKQTSFMSRGKNLFNKYQSTPNMMIDYNTGNTASNAQHLASDFIEVIPNSNYVINKDSNIAFYDASKVYISGVTRLQGVFFTTPVNSGFIRTSVKRLDLDPELPNKTQLELGTVISPYEEYIIGIDPVFVKPLERKNIKDKAVGTEKCDFFIPSKNLYDKSKAIDNYLVNGTNGSVTSWNGHSASDYIEVLPSTTYIINKKYNIAYYDSNKAYISGINSQLSLPFTTPANCKYIRFSLADYGTIPDIKESTQLEKGSASTVYSAFETRGLDPTKIDTSTFQKDSKFTGLKWNALGDSITEANKYQGFVNSKLQFSLVRNYGIGGTKIADTTGSDSNAFVNRYALMDNDADVVSIAGGTNDWGQNVIISNPTNKYDKSTIKGAARVIIEGLIAKYPGKYIVWATLPQRNNSTYPNGINANGDTTQDYATALKDVCREYAIPCIDVHNESGINQFNMNTNGSFMPDRVHPSDAGHKRIASLYIDMFNKTIY